MEYRRPGEMTTLETRTEAYETVDKKKRYKEIIEILTDNKEPMSAKEISVEMYKRGYTPTSERNFASPRLTEMLYDGRVETCGKKICQYSGVKVAVFKRREMKK